MERRCEKCGRDYTGDPSWSSKLNRHLKRKNPCTRTVGQPYVREAKVLPTMISLEEIQWTQQKCLSNVEHSEVLPWFFREIFSDPENACFVKPNKSKNEILVKVLGAVQVVKLEKFIKLFVNHIFLKQMYDYLCEDDFEFEKYLNRNLVVGGARWNAVYPDGCVYTNRFSVPSKLSPTFIVKMRAEVKDFLVTQENRVHIKNTMLSLRNGRPDNDT